MSVLISIEQFLSSGSRPIKTNSAEYLENTSIHSKDDKTILSSSGEISLKGISPISSEIDLSSKEENAKSQFDVISDKIEILRKLGYNLN